MKTAVANDGSEESRATNSINWLNSSFVSGGFSVDIFHKGRIRWGVDGCLSHIKMYVSRSRVCTINTYDDNVLKLRLRCSSGDRSY